MESYLRYPEGELALEESLEEDPALEDPEALRVEYARDRLFRCAVMLDCSSSMSGEKHLLACVAVAVLLLELPSSRFGLSVFSSRAEVIKALGREESREATLLRFLRHRAKGFTNIEAGLESGLTQFRRQLRRGPVVGLLASDGRSTEGGDPVEAARGFDHLVVLHLDGAGSLKEASESMARAGGGRCLSVDRFDALPRRMYEALRGLSRRG